MPSTDDQFKRFVAFWRKEFGNIPAADVARLEAIRLAGWIKARSLPKAPKAISTEKPVSRSDRRRGRDLPPNV